MKKKSTSRRSGKKTDSKVTQAGKGAKASRKTASKAVAKKKAAPKVAKKKPVSKKAAPAKKKTKAGVKKAASGSRKKATSKKAAPKKKVASIKKVAAKKTVTGEKKAVTRKKAVAKKSTPKRVSKPKAAKKKPAKAQKAPAAKSPRKSTPKKAVSGSVKFRPRTVTTRSSLAKAVKQAAELSKKGRRADGKLTARTASKLREVLVMMHNQLTGQAKALKTAALRREDDVYSPEDGTDVFERLFGLSVASSELDSVFEIEEALRRMDNKTYGLCEVCEKPISVPRLEAVPFVRTCIECQSAIEKGKIHYRPI